MEPTVTVAPVGAAASFIQPGTPATGRYALLEEIARGGMGVVHRAYDLQFEREVALKLVQDRHLDDAGVRRRFHDEARITGQLQHPGIPPVQELGALPDGRPFLAMKLIQGMTLEKLLAQADLPPGRKLAIFEGVCQAVAYAHSRGIIHRDLKSANIMVGAFGETQVMDWGLAKVLNEASRERERPEESEESTATDEFATQAGSAVGTYAYMPPEQALGATGKVGPASDVFGLGAVLCELLTGKPPYVGTPENPTSQQAARGDLRDAFQRIDVSDSDTELKILCKRCLAEEPGKRFADAGELAAELDAYRHATEQRAREAEVRAAKAAERRKRYAALALLFMLGTAISLVLAYRAQESKRLESAALKEQVKLTGVAEKALKDEEAARAERDRKIAALSIATQFAADAAFAENRAGRARELLAEVPEPLRNLEWRLRQAIFTGSYATLPSPGYLAAIAYSPDGLTVAGGAEDGSVLTWDARTGEQKILRPASGHRVTCLAYHPHGKWIIVGALDGVLRLIAVDTGNQEREWKTPEAFATAVAFDVDGGRLVAACSDNLARVWPTAGGEPLILKGHTLAATAAAFSPYGTRIVTGSWDSTVRVWDAETGHELRALRGHKGFVTCVAWSPDGARFLSGSMDSTARIWDADTFAELRTLRGHAKAVTAAEFGPDGSFVVTGSRDETLKVWDAASGTERATLRGHTGIVTALAIAPDGFRIASGSTDRTLKWWQRGIGAERLRLRGHTQAATGVAFDPTGAVLYSSCGDGSWNAWDARTGLERSSVRAHAGWVNGLLVRPDGARVASYSIDGMMVLRDPSNGKLDVSWRGHDRAVTCAAFGADGRWIASGSEDGSVRVSEAATGVEWGVSKAATPVRSVAFHPNGKVIAFGCDDGSITLDGVEHGATPRRLPGHGERVSALAFSPDGSRLASASWDGAVRIRDGTTGAMLAACRGHAGLVTGLVFSPDGMRLFSSSYDQTLAIWDAATGGEVAALRAPGAELTSVALSRDGTSVAAGANDGTIRVWKTATDEKSLREGAAAFHPFAANAEYASAATPYAKAFWKSRFALHDPGKPANWDGLRKVCVDEAGWMLLKRTCDLVLRTGPNERASLERAWAIEQLRLGNLEELPQPGR